MKSHYQRTGMEVGVGGDAPTRNLPQDAEDSYELGLCRSVLSQFKELWEGPRKTGRIKPVERTRLSASETAKFDVQTKAFVPFIATGCQKGIMLALSLLRVACNRCRKHLRMSREFPVTAT